MLGCMGYSTVVLSGRTQKTLKRFQKHAGKLPGFSAAKDMTSPSASQCSADQEQAPASSHTLPESATTCQTSLASTKTAVVTQTDCERRSRSGEGRRVRATCSSDAVIAVCYVNAAIIAAHTSLCCTGLSRLVTGSLCSFLSANCTH